MVRTYLRKTNRVHTDSQAMMQTAQALHIKENQKENSITILSFSPHCSYVIDRPEPNTANSPIADPVDGLASTEPNQTYAHQDAEESRDINIQ
ncbi:hypothetical protein J6590_038630 [Homalodisca vitripennis]|nr:hypothetical protein J6590_038630 [Homalodisca vitripennis]